jgi:hypothetical protein
MSLLQHTKRAVCTRGCQLSCADVSLLHSVSANMRLPCRGQPTELFELRWVYYHLPVKQVALKETPQPSCLPWDNLTTLYQPGCLHLADNLKPSWLCSRDMFTTVYQPSCVALKENVSWAVCAVMSLLHCVPDELCTQKRNNPPGLFAPRYVYYSVPAKRLHWKKSVSCVVCARVSFPTVYQPSCLTERNEPAELFALRWVYNSVPAKLFAAKRKKR